MIRIGSEYTDIFKTFKNKLQRSVPIAKTQKKERLPEDYTELYLLGLLMERNTLHRSRQIIKRICEEMVDYNELRVTPLSELTELLSEYSPEPEIMAKEILTSLNAIMDKFDTLNLAFLKDHNKAELKKIFSEINDVQQHGLDFLQMTGFQLPVLPLTNSMAEFLRELNIIPKEADYLTVKSFLEKHLKSSEYENFYWQLRKATETNIREKLIPRKVKKMRKQDT